jgi:hypothetical protein
VCALRRLSTRRSRRVHTSIRDNTRHPFWNEDFFLLVMDREHGKLTALLYDYDTIGADSLLGRCAGQGPGRCRAGAPDSPCMRACIGVLGG